MAKISRREVASTSSSSSSSSSSGVSAFSSSSSYAAGNNALASPANSGGSGTGGGGGGSGGGTPSVNNIAYGGKAAPGGSGKYAEPGSGHSSYSTAYPADPLRGGGATMDAIPNGSKDYSAALPTFTSTPAAPYLQNNKTQEQLLAAERERIRAEFFATYDVMTGVRIAATLGGFFGLMVFLIVWKSRSSSNETLKVLKDPKMAAVAAVCMQEEEEREIQEAMVATGMSIYPDEYDAIAYRRQRMLSLGNVSAPPMLNRGFRFSSVGGGGYSSLLEPPRRFSYSAVSGAGSLGGVGGGSGGGGGRRKSGSESSRILSNYPMGSSFGTDDYFIETEDEMDTGDYLPDGGGGVGQIDELSALHKRTDSTRSKAGFLEVPLMGQDSRRSSAMTCCSTESSYLERRCSAFTLGMANLPPSLQRKLSTASRTSSTDNWDYYYPDIQVIQPTPKGSPVPSERSLYEQLQQMPPALGTTITAPSTGKTRLNNIIPISSATTITKTNTNVNANNKTSKLNIAANTISTGREVNVPPPTFVRKHSIAYYDPESAQGGRKQEIHSISADTVDVYPYNQPRTQPLLMGLGCTELLGNAGSASVGGDLLKGGIQSAPPVGVHQGFHFTDSPTEELRLSMRRKIAVMELTRMPSYPLTSAVDTPTGVATTAVTYENNNSFPYTSSPAAILNSSSISVDSTPASMDKLNGSGSLGTISAKAFFNMEKRAPLASLSSFKISSLEYQDSELRSLDEDSVFLDSAADTDEDMQQLSSDSEEASLDADPQATTPVASLGEQQQLQLQPQLQQQQQQQHSHQFQDADRTLRSHTHSHSHTQHKYPIEKRYSLGAPNAASNTATISQGRRPLLQRHRTISASSSDRITLIGQQLRDLPKLAATGATGTTTGAGHGQTLQPMLTAATPQPLETHFGTVICTNSPPTHPRRAQLLQQYSDPASLPTTTTTTTTTTTEEDTCSTLNTEVCGDGGEAGTTTITTTVGGGGGESTTHTQHSSLNTVVSVERDSSNSQLDENVLYNMERNLGTSSKSPQDQQQSQLPRSRLGKDACASSISDSVVIGTSGTPRQPLICMPASLKNLILRGSSSSSADKLATSPTSAAMVTRSSTTVSLIDVDGCSGAGLVLGEESGMPSVSLELPLIKLPTDDDSSESISSNAGDDNMKRSGTDSSSRDPSLPGSSRKWSKETLF